MSVERRANAVACPAAAASITDEAFAASQVVVAIKMKRIIPFLLLMLLSLNCFGKTFSASINDSQWYLSSSIFECTLTHNIPQFGRAVFFHEAGEPLRFYLDSVRHPMRNGRAALVVEAPDWRPGREVRDLGFVDVIGGNRPVSAPNKQAAQMMDGLLAGMYPTFTRREKHSNRSIRVAVSSINFEKMYEDYLICIAGLLPSNFRQVERTSIFFKVNESVLTRTGKKALDKVIVYVKADPTITGIYVDGHTDSSGRRIFNRRLSKDRAEAVTQYILSKEISKDLVTTRYHGERYPVAKNINKRNKAKNRRSTVRLERKGELSEEAQEAFSD